MLPKFLELNDFNIGNQKILININAILSVERKELSTRISYQIGSINNYLLVTESPEMIRKMIDLAYK